MISRPDDPYRGVKRTFRVALIVSFLIHPLIIAFLMAHFDFRHPNLTALRKPPQKTETVTISSAPKRAVRTVARVEPRANRPVPQSVRRPREVRTVPHPQEISNVVAKPLLEPKSVPTFVPAIPQKHELAKLAEGTPVPRVAPKTERTPAPVTPPPQTPPPDTSHDKAVAYREKPSVAKPSKDAKFSDAQLAQINNDLAKSLQGPHGYNAPLSDERKQIASAEAPKHYSLDFHALNGAERYAQGLCDPIKEWEMNGYDYYYESCNVVEPDGTMNRKPVPWPVRYPSNNDPFTQTGSYRGTIPLAVPLPGWHADPAHPIDPDFIPYLRSRGYAI